MQQRQWEQSGSNSMHISSKNDLTLNECFCSSSGSTSQFLMQKSTLGLNDSSSPHIFSSSALMRFFMVLLMSWSFGVANAYVVLNPPDTSLEKYNIIDVKCKSIYDESIILRLNQICLKCYDLFREKQLEKLCRQECFSTEFFKGCMETMLVGKEAEEVEMWLKEVHNDGDPTALELVNHP